MTIFFEWLAQQRLWHAAWHRIDALVALAKAGRSEPRTCQLVTFKAFEAWVQEAQTAYTASDYTSTDDAIEAAAATFSRLSGDWQSLLRLRAAAARALEYRMQVADCCQ